MHSLQIDPELARQVLESGDNGITGWGIALFLSLSFNFLLWYELRSVNNKLIEHLQKSDSLLQVIHNFIISKN